MKLIIYFHGILFLLIDISLLHFLCLYFTLPLQACVYLPILINKFLVMSLASAFLTVLLCLDPFADSTSGTNTRRIYALKLSGSGGSYGNCNRWRFNGITSRYGDMNRLRRGYSILNVYVWTLNQFTMQPLTTFKLLTAIIMFKYTIPHVILLTLLPTQYASDFRVYAIVSSLVLGFFFSSL